MTNKPDHQPLSDQPQAETASAEPERTTERRVFLGYRQEGTRLIEAWTRSNHEDDDSRWVHFGSYRFKGFAVGEQVEFTVADDGNYFVAGERGPRHLGVFPDADKVAEWQAMSRAAKAAHDMEAVRRKVDGVDQLLLRLKPLRDAYLKLNYSERAALIAVMVEYLRK